MPMLLALGFSSQVTLAFVMAAGLIADIASLPLVVSKLVNIASADFFDVGFNRYAAVMGPVNLAAIAGSLGMLLLYFWHSIPVRHDLAPLRRPAQAVRDRATFKAGWIVLMLLLIGFFALEPSGVLVSVVSAAGAVLLLAVAARGSVILTRKVLREAPWRTVVFSLGMYLVVYSLRNAGLTRKIAGLLDVFALGGVWGHRTGHGPVDGFAVVGHEQLNLPSVLAGASSIDASQPTGVVREAMIYAKVISCDLGPKITPTGSLATRLWLHVLAKKGVRITLGYYFKVGIVLTVLVLLVSLAAPALRLA